MVWQAEKWPGHPGDPGTSGVLTTSATRPASVSPFVFLFPFGRLALVLCLLNRFLRNESDDEHRRVSDSTALCAWRAPRLRHSWRLRVGLLRSAFAEQA